MVEIETLLSWAEVCSVKANAKSRDQKWSETLSERTPARAFVRSAPRPLSYTIVSLSLAGRGDRQRARNQLSAGLPSGSRAWLFGAQRQPVMPCPSVIVKMRSTAGSLTFSTCARRPVNLRRSRVGCIAQPKVRPLIVGRDVAAAAHHVFALAHPVGGQIDGGSDASRGLFSVPPTSFNSTQW
jgi:hypothetical protein